MTRNGAEVEIRTGVGEGTGTGVKVGAGERGREKLSRAGVRVEVRAGNGAAMQMRAGIVAGAVASVRGGRVLRIVGGGEGDPGIIVRTTCIAWQCTMLVVHFGPTNGVCFIF